MYNTPQINRKLGNHMQILLQVIAVAVFLSIITKKSLDDSKYETTKLLEQSQTRALAFARDTKSLFAYLKNYLPTILSIVMRK